MPSHVGIEGNPQAELLATKGGLANPLNLIMQQNSLRGEPQGQPPQKKQKTETGHPSNRKELLSASDTAILLQSLSLEVMDDCLLDPDNTNELVVGEADVCGFLSSETASTRSGYYSSV